MKKRIGLLIVLTSILLTGCDTSSSVPDPAKNYFTKFYGGDGFQTGADLVVNQDGTFILFGTTGKSANESDARLFIVKADALGNIVWESTFGGVNGNEAVDAELISNAGQDIIVVANTVMPSGVQEILVQRFSNATGARLGDSVIVKVLNAAGVPSQLNKIATSIRELRDGSFLITGAGKNIGETPAAVEDALLVKLDGSTFDSQDPKFKTGSGAGTDNVSVRAFELADDSVYVCGYSNTTINGNSDYNFSILGFGREGEVTTIGNNNIIGEISSDERLGDAIFRSDATGDNFFLAGITTRGTASDIYVAEYSAGYDQFNNFGIQKLFQRKAGLSLSSAGQRKASLELGADGSMFVLANDLSAQNSDIVLIKLTSQGLPANGWNLGKTYGGAGEDSAGAIKELSDGKLVICGTLSINGETKMALMKVNKNGEFAQ